MKTNKIIHTIATHYRADQDEFVARVLLEHFGETIFPGVRDAKFDFLTSEPDRPLPGTLYLGIGSDRLGHFDEHRDGDRLQNECTATLVAKRLNVCSKPRVHELLGEVLWCDTRAKVFPSQLASLVKTMHRVKGGFDQFGTYLWTRAAINTIIFGSVRDDEYDIRRAWQNYREDYQVPEISDLEAFMSATQGRKETSDNHGFVTELASICAHMLPERRQKWLLETFDMLVQDNKMFQEAVVEVNTKAEVVEVETDHGPEPMTLIESDNEHVARASSSKKTGMSSVTVIRNIRGHTAILCNHERGIDLTDLAVMIRMAEYEKFTGGKKLSLERARGLGIVPACNQWCLANKNLLLNGSLTHPLVKASLLSIGEIKAIASRAFMQTQREAWTLNYYQGLLTSPVFDMVGSLVL